MLSALGGTTSSSRIPLTARRARASNEAIRDAKRSTNASSSSSGTARLIQP
jgi:hypothetical protein